MLFFFAGYEIDFDRIKGRSLELGLLGWGLSLALAYGVGGLLAAAGIVLSLLYTGSATATTAIGTLIPILRDRGELRTEFGTLHARRRRGGGVRADPARHADPVHHPPARRGAILLAFVALAVLLALVAVRSMFKGWPLLERTFETSSQLAVRFAVVLVFGLVALASELGLDLLLGGFVAGLITRQALQGREVTVFESKLTAIGYGFFIPFFFITSGMKFDLDTLVSSAGAMLKVPLFLGMFLLVRGLPALVLYRRILGSPRPHGARPAVRDGAAARRRHHHAGRRDGSHALVDVGGARGRGDDLDPRVPAARAAVAAPGAGSCVTSRGASRNAAME